MTVASRSKLTESLCTQKKACLPKCDLTYFFVQLHFDSIDHHMTIVQHKVTCLYRWLSECKTKHSWLTLWFDYWLLLRNVAPVLVWNFYGDCLTDYLRRLAFAAKLCTSSGVKLLRWLPTDYIMLTISIMAAKLLRWLSDDVALWLVGYRKNELRMTSSY